MTDIMPLQEIKSLCDLVRMYCRGEISKDEYWECRNKFFIQQDFWIDSKQL